MTKSTAPAFKELKMQLEKEKRTRAIQRQSNKYHFRGTFRGQRQARG